MRNLARNKKTVYYALYSSKTEIVDANGNKTGDKRIEYTEPTAIRVSVSASRGEAYADPFGINLNYSKTVITDDMDCPIKEDSVLWIDKEATAEVDGKTTVTPYNYVVVRKAVSLNNISYAVREVSVSA